MKKIINEPINISNDTTRGYISWSIYEGRILNDNAQQKLHKIALLMGLKSQLIAYFLQNENILFTRKSVSNYISKYYFEKTNIKPTYIEQVNAHAVHYYYSFETMLKVIDDTMLFMAKNLFGSGAYSLDNKMRRAYAKIQQLTKYIQDLEDQKIIEEDIIREIERQSL